MRRDIHASLSMSFSKNPWYTTDSKLLDYSPHSWNADLIMFEMISCRVNDFQSFYIKLKSFLTRKNRLLLHNTAAKMSGISITKLHDILIKVFLSPQTFCGIRNWAERLGIKQNEWLVLTA